MSTNLNVNIGSNNQPYNVGVDGAAQMQLPGFFSPLFQDSIAAASANASATQTLTGAPPTLLPPAPGALTGASFVGFLQQMPKLFEKVNLEVSLSQFQSLTQEMFKQSFQESDVSTAYTSALNSYIQTNNLSKEDADKLTFAFNNPDAAGDTTLSDGTKVSDIVGNLTNQVNTLFSTIYGVKPEDIKYDNSQYNNNLADTYNNNFKNAVLNDPSLTEDEKTAIIFKFFNPDAAVTLTPKMQGALDNYKAQARASLADNGVPDNWQVPLKNDIYNGSLKNDFGINVQIAVKNYASQHKLSPDEVKALLAALSSANPENLQLSPKLQAAYDVVMNRAIAQTKDMYGLPLNWQPNAADMAGILANTNSSMTAKGFVELGLLLANAESQIKDLFANSDKKDATLDILNKISKALANMRMTIQEMQLANTEASQKEGTAKLELQNAQNIELKKQQKEIDKNAKKQKILGILAKIFKPFMKIIEAIMSLLTGGLIGGLLLILDSKFNFIEKGVKAFTEGIAKLVDLMIPNNTNNKDLERFKHALKATLQILCMYGAFMMGTQALSQMGLGNPMFLIQVFMKAVSSGLIFGEIGQMCGMKEKDTKWLALGVTLAMTLAIAIASFFMPSGAAKVAEGAVKAADTAAKAAKTVQPVVDSVAQNIINSIQNVARSIKEAIEESKTLQVLVKELSKFSKGLNEQLTSGNTTYLNTVETTLSVGAAALQGVNATINALSAFSSARLAKVRGETDAAIEELRAMVKMLQKVIDALMKGLSGLGDDLKELTNIHDKMLSGLSAVLNRLTSHA